MSWASSQKANAKRVEIGRTLKAAGFALRISEEVRNPIEDEFRDAYWDGEARAPNKMRVRLRQENFGTLSHPRWIWVYRVLDIFSDTEYASGRVTTARNTAARIIAACDALGG